MAGGNPAIARCASCWGVVEMVGGVNNHIYEGNQKSPCGETRFSTDLGWFAGLFEFEGDGLMSRVRLFAEVCVNLGVRHGRDIDWGGQGDDGRKVSVRHFSIKGWGRGKELSC